MSLYFVGHVSVDVVEREGVTAHLPGGGVYFGAVAAGRLGRTCTCLTKIAVGDAALFAELSEDQGVVLKNTVTQVSTSFLNKYVGGDADNRVQWLVSRAVPFSKDDFSVIEGVDNIIHISPLFFGEFPEGLISLLRGKASFLSTDAQGFIRHIAPGDDKAQYLDWSRKAEFLGKFDMFKMDVKEAKILTDLDNPLEACRFIANLGVRFVLYTCKDCVSLYSKQEDRLFTAPFGEWKLEGRTGRGDTVVAAFLSRMFPQDGKFDKDYDTLVDFVADITTKKMQQRGAYPRSK